MVAGAKVGPVGAVAVKDGFVGANALKVEASGDGELKFGASGAGELKVGAPGVGEVKLGVSGFCAAILEVALLDEVNPAADPGAIPCAAVPGEPATGVPVPVPGAGFAAAPGDPVSVTALPLDAVPEGVVAVPVLVDVDPDEAVPDESAPAGDEPGGED